MDPRDLRDPVAERRQGRLTLLAIAVIAVLALAVAGYAAYLQQPIDHHYTYAVSFSNQNGATYVLRVPLPADGEWQAKWAVLGNATASIEETAHGRVLALTGWGPVYAVARLDTWRDVPLVLTTEVLPLSNEARALVELNTTGQNAGAFLSISLREADPSFITERFLEGDLGEGWSTMPFRETLHHA